MVSSIEEFVSGSDRDHPGMSATAPSTVGVQDSAIYTHRHRLSTSNPNSSACDDVCGMQCLCAMCLTCRCLFCPGNNMHPRKRVNIVWFWCITLMVVGWVVCMFVVFRTLVQHVADTDMRIAYPRLSPVFCASLSLQSTSVFTTFVFDKQPTVDLQKTEHFTSYVTMYVTVGSYIYRKFYLLEGSFISILSCADAGVYVYAIKGDTNFNTWKNNNGCPDCAIGSHYVDQSCVGTSRDNYTLTVSESADYYMAFASASYDSWVRADFSGRRTLYDTFGTRKECEGDMSCDVDLDIYQHQVVVYHMAGDRSQDDLSITTTCNIRIWFWVVVFCAGPLTLGVVFSVLMVKCHDDHRGVGTRDGRPTRSRISHFPASERTPLIFFQQSPDGARGPPRYEDCTVNGSNCLTPPSYEQATR